MKDSDRKLGLEDATVIVKSPATGAHTAITNHNGEFTIDNLSDGSYTVSATFAGANSAEQIVVLESGKSAQVELALSLSSAKSESYNIEVTGSLLGATPKDTPIPIYAVDRADTLKRGDPTILDQVKSTPIVGRSFGDANPFNADAQFRPGAGTINLRGLGPQRTLVLLNGQRFSANNMTAPDSHLLPSSVIGRVEILKDGAAATYGSDAIAGVANFITRQDVNGLELSADYRQVMNSVGDVNTSAAYGWTWDKGNVLLSAAYQFRGELKSLDRTWANRTIAENITSYSPYDNPGTWVVLGIPTGSPQNTAPQPISNPFVDANCTQLGGTILPVQGIPMCWSSYERNYNLINTTHQGQLYGEMNAKIGSSTKLHLDGLYAFTSLPTISINASFPTINGPTGPGTPFIVPGTNPGFAAFLGQTAPALAGAPLAAATAVWAPFSIGGNPLGNERGALNADSKNEEVRVSGDVTGDLGILDLGYKLSATYLIESQRQNFPDTLVARMQAALKGFGGPNCTGTTAGQNGCQWLNPFSNAVARNPVTGQTNPGYIVPAANVNTDELIKWITDSDRYLDLRNEFSVFDALVNGKVPVKLPGGEPSWVVGGQYRQTVAVTSIANRNFNLLATPCPNPNDSSCAVHTGPYTFSSGYVPAKIDLGVYALYGQLDIPTFDAWKTSVGLRWEDYSGAIGGAIGPQVRTKWQVFDWVALRGSLGTSFRGPTAADTFPGINVTQLEQIPITGNLYKANDRYGNPAVQPEKALTFNVGTVWQFLQKNLTATVDYWYYKLDNPITLVPPDLIAAAAVGPALPLANCSSPLVTGANPNVIFNNNNTCTQGTTTVANIVRVRSDTVNGPTVNTMGLDMELDYRIKKVFGGDLDLGGFASVVFNYKQDPFVFKGITISNAYDAVGFTNYNRLPGTLSRWRGQFFVNYNHGWHNARVTTSYIDGVTDNRDPNATFGLTLPGFVSLDAAYQLSLPWDMTFTVSAQNLIDMDPPSARLPFGYDPLIGSPLGRTFKFGLTQKF